jgi:hypothetical protein
MLTGFRLQVVPGRGFDDHPEAFLEPRTILEA